MVKPNFGEFAYTRSFDQDVIDEMVRDSRASRVYAPTGYSHETEAQHLAVYTTTPPEVTANPILRVTAFSDDNGRPDGRIFDAHLAAQTGSQVYAINNPGVESRQWADPRYQTSQELTPEQIEELKGEQGRGETAYRHVGAAVANAMAYMGLGTEVPVTISASSLGLGMAAGILRQSFEHGLQIEALAGAELVNGAPRRFATNLIPNFMTQGGYGAQYVAGNPDGIDKMEPPLKYVERVKEDAGANWHYARALARGTFFGDLGGVEGLEYVPVYLTRGAGSTLSQPEVFQRITNQFRTFPYFRTETMGDPETNPHTHPYTMTVEQVIGHVERTRE